MSELYQGPRTNDENGQGWQLAQEHDLLGFRNFTEGRISSKYVEMQRAYYKSQKGHRRSEMKWVSGFIENLIPIVHDQWTWRNEKLHYRRHPGAETAAEYEQIMKRIMNKLEMTDPEDLLPEDQYLLGVDPEELINTSPDGRNAWLANLDTAEAAAEHDKRRRDESRDEDEECMQSNFFRRPPSSACSVIKAGRRWKNKLRKKRIEKWKRHNFLGKHKIENYLSDDSDDESPSNTSSTPATITTTTAPSNPSRSNKRQATMNSWLGTNRESIERNSSPTIQSTQPPQPTTALNQAPSHTQQRNTRQASINNWLNQQTRQRTRNNPSPSTEEDRNASPSENQRLELSSSTNNRNNNKFSRWHSRSSLPFTSEGSQIYKRRRLKY